MPSLDVRIAERSTSVTHLSALILVAAALVGSDAVGASAEERLLGGALTRAEIERCLATAHEVGHSVFFPVPQPGYVFKPGYNFMVREPDGSFGFGHQQAVNGGVIVRYPAHRAIIRLSVTRKDGVVYFGSQATSCR